MEDPTNPPVNRLKAEDWEIETAIMAYFIGKDLDWIEDNLLIGRASLYRWLEKFGLPKRGNDK